MRRKKLTTLHKRMTDILGGNEGASLVLVTIIAIIIITGIVILRVTTSTLWASADKQYNQDQAYEMATSLGESLDSLIQKGKINLENVITSGGSIYGDTAPGLPNSTVSATVKKDSTGTVYIVTVRADVADATYVYTATYLRSPSGYVRQY